MDTLDNSHETDEMPNDRRVQTRRINDYFWLTRMSEVTGDGCLVVNRQLRIEFSDGRAAGLLEIPNITVEEGADFSQLALHMSEMGYFGPGDPRAFQALLIDLLVNQKMKQTESQHKLRVTTPMGRQIVMNITYGRDDRYIIVVRDLTDDFLEEQALSTALKIGESGYWYYNLKTHEFRMRGGKLLQDTGIEVGPTATVEDVRRIVHPDDFSKAMKTMADCIESRQAQSVVLRIRGGDGTIYWMKTHLMPNVDEGNQIRSVISFFHNITSQLRTQDELRAAQSRAERALKAKNAFLGRLAHEVRTPMNAVIGMSDALIHHHNDPAINPKLALIQDSAEKIVRLVDETLQHTKLQEEQIELDPREASPSDLAERVRALWIEQARKNRSDITVRIDPSVPETLVFDDFRMEQCLNNIVSNAVKFTESGVVDIVMSTTGPEKARHLVIAVRDTGIGMNSEQIKQVFLPFKQANRSISGRFGGTGLGMSITKDLIELMGGRITVKSEEGRGSIFVMTLPIILPSQLTVGSDELVQDILQVEEPAPRDYSDLRVLIVDDNATNHIVIGSLLQTVVGETQTAMNGEEAIERLRQDGPFDLVLMDIHMPVMDGIEATLAIRSGTEDFADIPIIALTADPQYQQARLCKNIGMDDALAKPVRLTGLLEGFDRVLGNSDETSTLADAA